MSQSKTNPRWILALIGLIAVAAVGIYVVRRAEQPDAVTAPAAAATTGRVAFLMEQQWLIKLKLAKAEAASMAPQIQSTGRVVPVPANHAVVASPVGGIIQSGTMPRVGQNVIQGQRLATLIQIPTAAEAAQMHIENSRLDAERRRLVQAEIEAKARFEEAVHDLGRSQRLYEQKAYSAKALEEDELHRTAAEAQLEAIREQIRALQPPTPGSSTYQVLAPISGTVVSVGKSSGEQVAPGEAILEVVALDTVWVEAPIFEKDLGKLARDVRAVFTTAAYPEREFQGRLIDVSKVVDEQSRTSKAIFEVPNRTGDLSIGMQANIRLDAGQETSVLLVPKESVLDNEGKKIVYVLLSGEEFERRDVVVGDEYGANVAILSGVKPGERVVTQGAYQLKLQELRPADAGAHTHET